MKKALLILSIFSLFFLSACSKFEDLEALLNDQVTITSVAVFNAVPNSQHIEVSIDGVKLNTGKEKLAYGKHLPFRNWPAGKKKITIVNSYKGGEDVYEDFVDLEAGQIYSLFVYKDNKLGVVQSKDDMIKPSAGFAKVRVAHMSNDAPPFVIHYGNDKQLYQSEIKYRDVTPFTNVNLANMRLMVNATKAGATPQLDYSFTPKNQGIYTFLIRGHIHSTSESDEFEAQLIEH
ncbi:MAG TPA: DUF4397 domain-containing protein [Sphingobacterium sp.]|nr:DUF4397 domain-containing protein [Sphingobacterium sp.]